MGEVQAPPSYAARFFATSLALAGSACILLVPSAENGGSQCLFRGVASPCGSCLAARCGAAIDACCSEEACGGVIADVELCVDRSDAAACARAREPADRGGRHTELSACMVAQCADSCGPATPPKNVTRCKPAYVTSIEACSCELGDKPNDVVCTDVGHPKLRCCAPEAWPGPALSCDCLTIICVPIADGCLCELTAMDDNGRASECSGAHCCVDPKANQGHCGSQECHNDEVAVPSCNVDQLACTAGRHRVTTCSVASP